MQLLHTTSCVIFNLHTAPSLLVQITNNTLQANSIKLYETAAAKLYYIKCDILKIIEQEEKAVNLSI